MAPRKLWYQDVSLAKFLTSYQEILNCQGKPISDFQNVCCEQGEPPPSLNRYDKWNKAHMVNNEKHQI